MATRRSLGLVFRPTMRLAAFLTVALLCGCATNAHQEALQLSQSGDDGQAEALLQEDVRYRPDDWRSYFLLGRIYQRTGRPEQARLVFQQILHADPAMTVEPGVMPGFEGKRLAEAARRALADLEAQSKGAGAVNGASASAVDSLERDILGRGETGPGNASGRPRASEAEMTSWSLREEGGFSRTSAATGHAPAGSSAPSVSGGSVSSGRSSFGVHVFSYKHTPDLSTAAREMRATVPGLFEGKEFRLQRVDLAGKGEFQRLVAGPYPSRAAAQQACVAVKRVTGFCQVTPF